MKRFKVWMDLSTTQDKLRLAKLSGTSRTYLYQIASGLRVATSDKAADISAGSRQLYIESGKRLFVLERSDLSPACAACPYSPKCRK